MAEPFIPYLPGYTPESPDLPPHLQGDPNAQVPFRLPEAPQVPRPKQVMPDDDVSTTTIKRVKQSLAEQGADFNEIARAAAAQYNIDPNQVEGLSDKDKYRMLLRMGINMMAAASVPGATTAGSLAAGFGGAMDEEDKLQAARRQRQADIAAGRDKAVDRALDIAGKTEASKRNAIRDKLYAHQIETQRRAQVKPQYVTDTSGTRYAVTGAQSEPVMTPDGVPLRVSDPATQRSLMVQATKIFDGLKKDLRDERSDDEKWAQALRQVGLSDEEPYGEPIGIAAPEIVE